MPQLFKTDPREDAGLTTADLARTSDRPSTTPRDRSIDEPAPLRSNRNSTTFNQEDATFLDQTGEDANLLGRSEGDIATQFNPDTPAEVSTPLRTGSQADDSSSAPLFAAEETNGFHARWSAVQVGFVDEPRRAVQQADSLVAEAIKRLAEIFADERAKLDKQWDGGDSVSTEDLRIALRRYRSFFGRLLSV